MTGCAWMLELGNTITTIAVSERGNGSLPCHTLRTTNRYMVSYMVSVDQSTLCCWRCWLSGVALVIATG